MDESSRELGQKRRRGSGTSTGGETNTDPRAASDDPSSAALTAPDRSSRTRSQRSTRGGKIGNGGNVSPAVNSNSGTSSRVQTDAESSDDDDSTNISRNTRRAPPPKSILGLPTGVIISQAVEPVVMGLGVGGNPPLQVVRGGRSASAKSAASHDDQAVDAGELEDGARPILKRVRRTGATSETEETTDAGESTSQRGRAFARLNGRTQRRGTRPESAQGRRVSSRRGEDGSDTEETDEYDRDSGDESDDDGESRRSGFTTGAPGGDGTGASDGVVVNRYGWRRYAPHPSDAVWGPLGHAGIPEVIKEHFAATEHFAKAKGREHKGLRHFSLRVCDKLSVLSKSTYNNIADILVNESRPLDAEGASGFDEKNIRRRIYDALNVLTAIDVLSKEKKILEWRGLPTEYNVDAVISRLTVTRDRLEKKMRLLEDLTLQYCSTIALIQRNAQREATVSNDPSPPTLRPPFVLVDSDASTVVDIVMTPERQQLFLDYSNFFSINDHHVILKLIAKNNPDIVQPGLRPFCPTTFPDIGSPQIQLPSQTTSDGKVVPPAVIPRLPTVMTIEGLQDRLPRRPVGSTPAIQLNE